MFVVVFLTLFIWRDMLMVVESQFFLGCCCLFSRSDCGRVVAFNGKNFSVFGRLVLDHPYGGRVGNGATFGWRRFQIQFSVDDRSILRWRKLFYLFFFKYFSQTWRMMTFTLASTSAAALPIPIEAPEAAERSDFLGAALLSSEP